MMHALARACVLRLHVPVKHVTDVKQCRMISCCPTSQASRDLTQNNRQAQLLSHSQGSCTSWQC